jgi:SAM-dependent methyltransferase
LAPLDQFHLRGLVASKEMAAALELTRDSTVLDIGCGLGGPARFIAATYGCQVTGIDLSQDFIDVATMLTARSGLADRVTYRQANALDLPFADASFDHGWTQHVAMNIADRAGLYASIHRVLKPGGRLAIYDVISGDGKPLTYPVPWARKPEISFLLNTDQMRDVLGKAGFAEISWQDKTAEAIAWGVSQRQAQQAAAASSAGPRLGLNVVMGSDFPPMVGNLARNLEEGRVRVVQAILRRVA